MTSFLARFGLVTFALLASFFLSPFSAEARDLQGRLGLGFNGQFPTQRGSTFQGKGIALKYGFTKDLAIEPIVAFATGVSTRNTFALKFYKNIFYETNLNFYFFGAGAAEKLSGASSFAIQGGFGSEFFIPGLESLAFSFEVGGEVSDAYGKTSLRTLGLTFLESGMRFYF
jgi:hypothetical protein